MSGGGGLRGRRACRYVGWGVSKADAGGTSKALRYGSCPMGEWSVLAKDCVDADSEESESD